MSQETADVFEMTGSPTKIFLFSQNIKQKWSNYYKITSKINKHKPE